MEHQLVVDIPNDLRYVEETVEYVVSRCTTCEEAARRLHFNFRVSLCEAISNAMIYGNGRDPSKRVCVEVALTPGRLVARITDEGVGFDPAAVPDPTLPRNLEREGGRGLFLMRRLMDRVEFNDRGNSVTLVLQLPAPEREASGARA